MVGTADMKSAIAAAKGHFTDAYTLWQQGDKANSQKALQQAEQSAQKAADAYAELAEDQEEEVYQYYKQSGLPDSILNQYFVVDPKTGKHEYKSQ